MAMMKSSSKVQIKGAGGNMPPKPKKVTTKDYDSGARARVKSSKSSGMVKGCK